MNPSMQPKATVDQELIKLLRRIPKTKIVVNGPSDITIEDLSIREIGDPNAPANPADTVDFLGKVKGAMQAAGFRGWVVTGTFKRKDASVRIYNPARAKSETQFVQGESGEKRLFKARPILQSVGDTHSTDVGVARDGKDVITVMVDSKTSEDAALSSDAYMAKIKRAIKAAGFTWVGGQAYYTGKGHGEGHSIKVLFR